MTDFEESSRLRLGNEGLMMETGGGQRNPLAATAKPVEFDSSLSS